MHDQEGNVRGIRLRATSGRKFSVAGGREGLFLPEPFSINGPLVICEGPTDTAALLDLGFAAVGRPSCTGGAMLLVGLIKGRMPLDVAIIADGDHPGRLGTDNLASILVPHVAAVRIIEPPDGVNDARDWKRRGATHADVRTLIEATPARPLSIRSRQNERRVLHARR